MLGCKAELGGPAFPSWRPDRKGIRAMGTEDRVALYDSYPFHKKPFQLVRKTESIREAAPGHQEAFKSDPGNTSGRRHWNSETMGRWGTVFLAASQLGTSWGHWSHLWGAPGGKRWGSGRCLRWDDPVLGVARERGRANSPGAGCSQLSLLACSTATTGAPLQRTYFKGLVPFAFLKPG